MPKTSAREKIDMANQVEPHLERGNALYMQGRYAEAADCYRLALRQRPENVDARNNLGAALADLGRANDAIACYQEVLRLQPHHAGAYYNLGNVFRLAGRYDEAIACYAQALLRRPDLAEGHHNLAITLRRLGRLAEAHASIRRALELRPGNPGSLVSLGLVLAESGRLAEALACYDQALAAEPDNADAHHNRAQAWLQLGDWTRGWPEYEWRWKCSEFTPRDLSRPPWDGSSLDGRTILLHAEQGAGDTLQFVRYARQVKRRGGTVLLSAPERLHAILHTADGIDRLLPPIGDAPLPDFDIHCPLLSLPAILATTLANVPADVPYLDAEADRVEHWRKALEGVAGFRVGIAWQGNRSMLPNDLWRSVPLARFEPLARVDGVQLISLQRGEKTDTEGRVPIVLLSERFDEDTAAFLDTAAVMRNLDLVVTCDTAIAHLAGALGVPAWVVLPAIPNWRWLLDRDDTPWYPTIRLFRQVHFGRWEEPFERVAGHLTRLAAAARSRG
jgi:Flp pilus assembly protein TadD